MFKKILVLLMTLSMIVLSPLYSYGQAKYISDGDQAISDQKEAELNESARNLSEKYGVKVAYTVIKSLEGENLYKFGQRYYEENFGQDSGFMLISSIDDRLWGFYVTEDLRDIITEDIMYELYDEYDQGDDYLCSIN